jgi:transcriptional regulator with XRE-family HTH domain
VTIRRVGLVRARKSSGHTQESLAKALQVDRSTVVRWEAGTSEPLPNVRPKLAHLLQVSSSDLEILLSPLDATPNPQENITSLLTRLVEIDINGIAASQEDGTYDSFTALREWVAMNRRELIRLLGLTVASTAASPILNSIGGLNPDEQERLAGALAVPSRVDEQVIGHIDAVLLAARANNRQLGPQAALHTVLAQQQILRAMAVDCPNVLRPQLLSVLANTLRIAGWLSFDSNEFLNAQYYYEQARTVAHEAGDGRITAYILGNMSQLATWTGKPHIGLDHAVVAQVWATKTKSVPLQAFASDIAAEAVAATGDYDQCMHELDHTEALMATLDEHPASPHYYYSTALHVSRRGECLLQLGRATAASEIITKSLAEASLLSEGLRGVALSKLDLGKAYIQTKDIDEATKIVGEVANLVGQNRSARLVKELRITRKSLQPWNDTAAVKGLDERLYTYGFSG